MKAYIEVRSQKSRGNRVGQFGGPDTYVAVQIVPDGVERMQTLNRAVAKRRGIRIVHCGEGYRNHSGPNSKLGQALAEAERIAAQYNAP